MKTGKAETQENLALLVLQGNRDPRVQRVQRVCPGLRGRKGSPAKRGLREHRVQKVHLVLKAQQPYLELRVPQGRLGNGGRQDRQAHREPLVTQALKDEWD